MNSKDPKNYDDLECPFCGEVTKPTAVSKNHVVKYECQNDACGETFKIDSDGDLIE